jgi:hypothetical protein
MNTHKTLTCTTAYRSISATSQARWIATMSVGRRIVVVVARRIIAATGATLSIRQPACAQLHIELFDNLHVQIALFERFARQQAHVEAVASTIRQQQSPRVDRISRHRHCSTSTRLQYATINQTNKHHIYNKTNLWR